MLLLRFRLSNHRSFRDEAELSFLQSRLKSARPHDGQWADYTTHVAAIYGANASGKSSVLGAMELFRNMIQNSATAWADRKKLPQTPFKLDDVSSAQPTSFVLDFAIDDLRHEYGFTFTEDAIVSEWLYDYPVSRRRVLFERNNVTDYKFGRALRGETAILEKITGQRELFLSRAASSRHELLREIMLELTSKMRYAEFTDASRQTRIAKIAEGLADGEVALRDIVTLLKVADVGIGEVEVKTSELPAEVLDMIQRMINAAAENPGKGKRKAQATKNEDNSGSARSIEGFRAIDSIQRALEFSHLGQDGKYYNLPAVVQSTGTMSWLSLALPSVEILRHGGALLIDELDASLHPQLAQVLIQMFKDPLLNQAGAQLIFTTHDTYFLSPAAEVRLGEEEVWFAEKDRSGLSELYALSDFNIRDSENISRRYLHGRYGATPSVAPSFLASLFDQHEIDA
ncbi:AAA family ATPase [Clavibacter zhangzhiyongii]|uniref:ATP-binding protein n=1 Tax=Clavibacter zhangzhiyongii TaxID=2768071 RepID=A0A7L7Z1G5_9MICO|nr:ATP-binding protein [Clavibacter zhangzhiyongii]QOD43532.1 ATP-binding protein [Clavibacter zhangzhiyongii]